MGNLAGKSKKTIKNDGIVKHRGPAENRVSESEMQLAELKSRIRKIK